MMDLFSWNRDKSGLGAGNMTRSEIVKKVQVNIPFSMLGEGYLDRFLNAGLNPEIGFDAQTLDHLRKAEVAAVAERFHAQGATITCHGPFADLSPGSLDPKIREITRYRFEQLLALLPVLKPKTVVCHAGYDENRYWYNKSRWIEESLGLWAWLAQRIKNEGAVLMLENVYERHPEDVLALLDPLGFHHVGFCLDTGHQAVFGHVGLENWMDTLGPFLGQVHLHDNGGEKDDHLALGGGRVDFKRFFEKLRSIKTEAPVMTLEPHRERDLQPSLEYLEKIWPWSD